MRSGFVGNWRRVLPTFLILVPLPDNLGSVQLDLELAQKHAETSRRPDGRYAPVICPSKAPIRD